MTGSLLAVAAIAPASATPADGGVFLSSMKDAFWNQPRSERKLICKAYRIAPQQLIAASVTSAMKDPASPKSISRAGWKRVITKYVAWACSGPGTTPR
jgi:hypothetical protein